MKKLRTLIAVMAMMSMAAVLTGCGDDDDNDDDDVPPPGGPEQFAPLDEAALTAQNKTYTVNVAGQGDPITLTFPAAGRYQMVQAGSTEVGAISGATRDVNRWTMNVAPDAEQEGAQAGVLRLDFTAANAGTWTFTPTDGTAETGTFTVAEAPGGGDEGGDNGGPVDRTTLTGKTLQVTYGLGGGERFDFITATDMAYEATGTNPGIAGTYTWDQANARVNITLNNGNLFEITIPEGSNQATVVFRQNADDNDPATDTGTYTLQ